MIKIVDGNIGASQIGSEKDHQDQNTVRSGLLCFLPYWVNKGVRKKSDSD